MRLVFGATWFEKARPFIKSIVERSDRRFTEDSIRAALDAGAYWLTVAVDGEDVRAALLANPITWAGGLRELEVMGLSGIGMKDWLHLEDEFRAKVKAMGFEILSPRARPGWARVMKSRGYQMTHVKLELRLKDG